MAILRTERIWPNDRPFTDDQLAALDLVACAMWEQISELFPEDGDLEWRLSVKLESRRKPPVQMEEAEASVALDHDPRAETFTVD